MKSVVTAFLLMVAVLTASAQPSKSTHSPHTTTSSDKPSIHGMFVFGSTQKGESLYASHLPLFRSPHDYQVLLELSLDDMGRKIYGKSRKNFPLEQVYTLVPEEFILPEMLAKPRPFKARLYRGHFERGGKPIGDTMTVTIAKVLYVKKFDPKAQHSDTTQFLVFGSGKALFAAHLISAKPDYDQILFVKPDATFNDAKLNVATEGQCKLVSLPTVKNDKGLKDEARVSVVSVVQGSPKQVSKHTIQVVKTLYLEYDDLR